MRSCVAYDLLSAGDRSPGLLLPFTTRSISADEHNNSLEDHFIDGFRSREHAGCFGEDVARAIDSSVVCT